MEKEKKTDNLGKGEDKEIEKSQEEPMEEIKAPGWDAIDNELNKIYPDIEGIHYGNISPFGEERLKGITVYDVDGENPHWHFITYGLTELYEKEFEDPNRSGYGFELTFRLAKTDNDTKAPNWALNFLNNIANYIFKTGNIFSEGHYLNTNGPIEANSNTKMKAIVFSLDNKLKSVVETPNGKIKFIQMTGITLDELDAMIIWNTGKVLNLLELPMNITYMNRESNLTEKVKDKIELGIEMEGSSTRFLYVDKAYMERDQREILFLGALCINNFKKLLKGVVLKWNTLTLYSEYKINFNISIENEVVIENNSYNIYLTEETINEIMEKIEVKSQVIVLDTFEGFDIVIEKSYVKDRYGNILETVG